MDWNRVKHMITRKSTWVVVFSQLGIILNAVGAFDSIQLDKYKIITNSILVIVETIGLVNIYQTEPLKIEENNKSD